MYGRAEIVKVKKVGEGGRGRMRLGER